MHLRQGINGVDDVNMDQHHSQAVAALQLLDAVVHVLWLQQVEPAPVAIVQCEPQTWRTAML